MHPSLEYALICCVAAGGSFLLTPLARKLATRWGAVAWPRDRDVHAVATPRMGGVALFLGFAMAILIARALPTLRQAFTYGPDFDWVLVACAIICLVGVLDDRYELDSLTKLAGQVVAAGVHGDQGRRAADPAAAVLGHMRRRSTSAATSRSRSRSGSPCSPINAVNFIDGLDGLAAGVTAIGAGAFFVYAYHLAILHYTDVAAAPALLSAALVGACVGFLPHNFAPARVFMGDSGSMLVGLLLSAAAVTATTTVDPQTFTSRSASLPLALPLIIPLAVLAVPLIDLSLAVIRRVRARPVAVRPGQAAPAPPDARPRPHPAAGCAAAVLLVGADRRRGVTFAITHRPWTVVVTLVGLALVGMLVSVVPRLTAYRRVGVHR